MKKLLALLLSLVMILSLAACSSGTEEAVTEELSLIHISEPTRP